MGFEEIDESYRKEVEKADKDFVEAIKKKVNLKESEIVYLKKLKIARERYNKLVRKNIKLLKGEKKKAKKIKSKVNPPFKVNLERYNLTGFEKFKYKFGLFKFKLRISLRNFRKEATPRIVYYYFVIIKFKLKKAYKKLVGKISDMIDSVKNSFAKSYENFKELTKKFYEKISNLPEFLMNKLKNLRNGGKKEDVQKKEEKE